MVICLVGSGSINTVCMVCKISAGVSDPYKKSLVWNNYGI